MLNLAVEPVEKQGKAPCVLDICIIGQRIIERFYSHKMKAMHGCNVWKGWGQHNQVL